MSVLRDALLGILDGFAAMSPWLLLFGVSVWLVVLLFAWALCRMAARTDSEDERRLR